MAWTSPTFHIFVTGEVLTASTMNTYVKDNLIDLDRRTSPVTAAVMVHQTTTSFLYGDLATAGPAAAVDVGSTGLSIISWSVILGSDDPLSGAWMSVAMSGSTTLGAADDWALNYSPSASGTAAGFGVSMIFGSNPGLCTYTCKYRVDHSPATAFFDKRRIIAQPLGS